jgi:hypothetical protein
MRLVWALAIFCEMCGTAAGAEIDEFWKEWKPKCSIPHFEQKYEQAALRLKEAAQSDPSFHSLNEQVTLAKEQLEDCKSRDPARVMRALGRTMPAATTARASR